MEMEFSDRTEVQIIVGKHGLADFTRTARFSTSGLFQHTLSEKRAKK